MENGKSFARNSQAKRIIIFTLFLVAIVIALLLYDGIAYKKLLNILIAPAFLFVPLAEFFLLRKRMFGKVRISDEGVSFTYKEIVMKEMKWQEMKRVEAYVRVIVFSKTEKAAKGIHHFNFSKNYISIDLDNNALREFCQELKKHLPKLSFTIDSKTLQKIDNYSALANKKS